MSVITKFGVVYIKDLPTFFGSIPAFAKWLNRVFFLRTK